MKTQCQGKPARPLTFGLVYLSVPVEKSKFKLTCLAEELDDGLWKFYRGLKTKKGETYQGIVTLVPGQRFNGICHT